MECWNWTLHCGTQSTQLNSICSNKFWMTATNDFHTKILCVHNESINTAIVLNGMNLIMCWKSMSEHNGLTEEGKMAKCLLRWDVLCETRHNTTERMMFHPKNNPNRHYYGASDRDSKSAWYLFQCLATENEHTSSLFHRSPLIRTSNFFVGMMIFPGLFKSQFDEKN